MGNENEFKETLQCLLAAIESGDQERVNKEKYRVLWNGSNLFELVANYIFLYNIGITFDFGSSIIKKGTKLYRIRDYKDTTDYSKLSQWQPSPYKSQGRINSEGQEALYLGSSEQVCVLETHKRYPQKYVLGEYECTDDIKVGGFISYEKNNKYHTLAAIILNAFLIAPSRSEKNIELFDYLERKIGSITLDDLSSLKNTVLDPKEEIKLPYKFALLNQRDKLYNLTNILCKIIKEQYSDGIRYSSCYIPLETPGIVCSDYNIALYRTGIDKLKFIGFSIKSIDCKNPELFNDVNVTKALLGDFNNDQT